MVLYVLSELCSAHALTKHDFYDWLSPPTRAHTQTHKQTDEHSEQTRKPRRRRSTLAQLYTHKKERPGGKPQYSCVCVGVCVMSWADLPKRSVTTNRRIPVGKWAELARFLTGLCLMFYLFIVLCVIAPVVSLCYCRTGIIQFIHRIKKTNTQSNAQTITHKNTNTHAQTLDGRAGANLGKRTHRRGRNRRRRRAH